MLMSSGRESVDSGSTYDRKRKERERARRAVLGSKLAVCRYLFPSFSNSNVEIGDLIDSCDEDCGGTFDPVNGLHNMTAFRL